MGVSYQPPSQNQIAGELLDLNYDQYKKRHLFVLTKDIEVYGLTYFGDGAMVKKMPLINILASSVHMPVALLEIVNCSKHASEGGKKDARYIASLFRPHIDETEAQFPSSTDVLFFDGAANVQKAGEVIRAKYPRIMVLNT